MQRVSSLAALTLTVVVALTACHPRNQTERGEGRHGGRLRAVCADDISKYCQNADRPRRCLRDNLDKLGAGCKAFLEAHPGGKRNQDNSSKSNSGND